MKSIGIISEYNPFHTGHQYMIKKLRQMGYDTIICAMSGNYVQRGESAILSKAERAKAAIKGGADLVLEIPTPWAMATAEIFARGGIEILSMAGCEALGFGAETDDLTHLQSLVSAIESPKVNAQTAEYLKKGITYAQAREQAVRDVCGDLADLMKKPNCNLAIEYMKEIRRQGSQMVPVAVERIGAEHDGMPADNIASASYIRKLIHEGKLAESRTYLPETSFEILQKAVDEGCIASPENLEKAILGQLRRYKEEELSVFDSGNEGLYHRLYTAIQESGSLEEIVEKTKTKRYTHARIRRMIFATFLGIDEIPKHVPYLHVLGANQQGIAYLHEMKKRNLPILTKCADVDKISNDARNLLEKEAFYTDLYVLGYTNIMQAKAGQEWRSSPYIDSERPQC